MAKTMTEDRISRLKAHLKEENPVLAEVVGSFQELDQLARKLGLMDADESYATQVSWWPVIAVLGTFSAGKSTFLNQLIGRELQRTGNQAVDDKFTVICFGPSEESQSLPGMALDSDPRFPFYQISQEIEAISEGEGRRVDSYLQLKTANSEVLRGKIFIDSPGFDADQQRSATLTLTDRIIDLSDLVLMFFDARHPEPGAMRDTLQHLVGDTSDRADTAKFLYILNQLDNTAREDNPEEVVAAWQRALAQHGLTAGRFYRIYARDAAVNIDDDNVRQRMEAKRDLDLGEIEQRIEHVEVERAYSVIRTLEQTGKHLRDKLAHDLIAAHKLWNKRTSALDLGVFGALLLVFLYFTISGGYWEGWRLTPFADLATPMKIIVAVVVLGIVVYLHSILRKAAGRSVLRRLKHDETLGEDRDPIVRAFKYNLESTLNAYFSSRPRGWSGRTRRRLENVIAEADRYVQKLNDRYTRPSGQQ